MKKFIASVNDSHMGRIDEIVNEMKNQGIQVNKVHKNIGVIIGSTDKKLEQIRISGIKIEPNRKMYASDDD